MNATQGAAAVREMPRYRCHKRVWALKIAGIIPSENPDPTGLTGAASYGAQIVPADEGYAPFEVPAEYMTKHRPHVGGYYLVYEDGYQSFSPAEPFENGYTLIGEEIQPVEQLSQREQARVSAALAFAQRQRKPRRGDIVDYTLPEWQHAPNGEPTVPAIITVVHSDTCVNLRLFADQEPHPAIDMGARPPSLEWYTSVVRQRGEDGKYPAPGCWDYRED